MSTSAAVYVEAFDVTVRVNADGYPDHMLPALDRLVEQELLERFVQFSEYSFVASSSVEYRRMNSEDYYAKRYVNVEDVGFAFFEYDAIKLKTAVSASRYVFENDENYEYVVTRDGNVIINKGE